MPSSTGPAHARTGLADHLEMAVEGPVSISVGPNRSAYVGVLGGLVLLRDGTGR